ncbi:MULTISPECIES: MerR family transcriptional regulator [Streptomyces]|uniref:MerR family transcriptional regulator n=1 Tax=Streptomyces TaxID=1883 RepID=UPI0004C842ED|nr:MULTISPECIES: MerR family transcriptional regulator [Streptomyces]MBD2833308.1 MerR family transcriptional regulator [Streptomyces pratensis]MDF0370711.1 MerR family transcriptional regulator [Streptomyces sp. KA12]MDF6064060.1 MerR family transcriptional regulator [Streptomyces sp. JH010]MDF9870779.1 DNA-binding transcriptional MerR regulator [Streptomyces pratensis]MEE1776642.1 MerR family transcriptional regulator [Streptomyces sp. JV181]
MFTIGEFARHGRVSARMLRHYDAIGLLRPDRIDPATGYRYYGAAQLARLNRVIALKDLGFTLQQVRAVVDDQVDADELRGMLRLRRAELEAAMTAAAARLTQVEARLRSIESEGHMPENDVQIKRVPAVRVAEVTSTAPGYQPQDISPVVGPLYEKLFPLLATAGVRPTGPGIARYEDGPDGDGSVVVHAGVTVDAPAGPLGDTGVTVVELPAFEAATIVHRGSMDHVLATEQILARWIEDHGRRPAGYSREVSLECPEDREMWVTELQLPLVG